TTTTSTTSTPAPKPKPKSGSASLLLPDAFFVNGAAVTIPGRRLHVEGIVHPYVAGQTVLLKAYLGRRLIKSARLRVKAGAHQRYGQFSQVLVSPGIGDVSVYVTHGRTATLSGFKASRRYAALDTNIHFGSIGRFVVLVQQRLAALHFYLRQSGVYDSS